MAAGSAMAQGTNATGSQARPDSPAQVTPNPKNQQNTSTFKPAKPASQPAPTSTNKAKAEK
jgi:hypothetical protein